MLADAAPAVSPTRDNPRVNGSDITRMRACACPEDHLPQPALEMLFSLKTHRELFVSAALGFLLKSKVQLEPTYSNKRGANRWLVPLPEVSNIVGPVKV